MMRRFRNTVLLVPIVLMDSGHREPKLAVDFDVFALMQTAMDFPENVNQVKNCHDVTNTTTECTIFHQIQSEVSKLFQNGSPAALKLTLKTIRHACGDDSREPTSRESREIWNECVGASSALVFFSSAKEDQQIVDFFEQQPHLLDSILNPSSFPNLYVWFNNRQEKERWMVLINSLNTKRTSHNTPVLRNPFQPETMIISSYQKRITVLNLLLKRKE